MLLRRNKAAYAVGRPSWRSSFLGDPGAKFLCGKLERGTKKEKSSKKERKEGLWKLTLLMGIRKERGFPQQLEKSLAKDARLFHSSHRPNNKDLSILYCRQRSTLIRLNFGPKDGEHLSSRAEACRVFALERVLHAAAVTFGGERSWSSAAVNRSMTLIGPPHLGQHQDGEEFLVPEGCDSTCG